VSRPRQKRAASRLHASVLGGIVRCAGVDRWAARWQRPALRAGQQLRVLLGGDGVVGSGDDLAVVVDAHEDAWYNAFF
jgi:hypothetical protein